MSTADLGQFPTAHDFETPVRISVVVPAFNEEDFLADALESLLRQDFGAPYEIIVVDNNSTDATSAVAQRFGVRVLHEPRPGVCAARQRGTVAARGDIVVSTDADTVHPPDWLARVDAEFSRSVDVALVAGPCRYQNPTWWAALYPRIMFGGVRHIHALTGRLVYITATNTAFLRTAFPGYDPALTQGGDELDLLRRIRRQGRTVWLADNAVATSPRRLERGLFYSFFVSLLGRYLITYGVNRLASQPLAGAVISSRVRRAKPTQPSPQPSPETEPEPTEGLGPRSAGWRLVASSAAVWVLGALSIKPHR